MDALTNQEVKQKTLEMLELKLKKLNYAFSRIDDEEFGECNLCLQTIPMQRLLLMPETSVCVQCAEQQAL